MLFSENNYAFMFKALQLAEQAAEEEEVPVGAIVIYNNRIIGRGYNQVEKLKDSTAHAEIIAITSACSHLNSKFLNDCDLYVTLEPCLMCTGAIIHAKIKNLYFAASDPKYGACGSLYNIIAENKLNHKVNVFSGIYEKESKSVLKSFFQARRN